MLTGALIGTIVGTLAVAYTAIVAKRQAADVLPVLRDKGPLTIPQLMEAMGKRGGRTQRVLVMSLDQLVKTGQVVASEVPPGTPQREKLRVRTYASA
jgi:DNA-binding HxlR family transcriptional regulator